MLKPKDPGRWSHLKLAHLSDAILTNNALYQGDYSRATVLLRHWEHLEVREVFLTGDFGVLFITIYLKNKTYQNHRWILFEGKLQRNGNQVGDPTSCFPEKWNTAFGQCSLAARDDNEDYEKVPLHEILREEGSALSSRVPRIPWFSGKHWIVRTSIFVTDKIIWEWSLFFYFEGTLPLQGMTRCVEMQLGNTWSFRGRKSMTTNPIRWRWEYPSTSIYMILHVYTWNYMNMHMQTHCIYIYVYTCTHIYIYIIICIYIYICMYICMCIYIYMSIYIYILYIYILIYIYIWIDL
jgi:hypothetical protein